MWRVTHVTQISCQHLTIIWWNGMVEIQIQETTIRTYLCICNMTHKFIIPRKTSREHSLNLTRFIQKWNMIFFGYHQTGKLQRNTIFHNKQFLVFSFIHMEIYFDMIYLIEYYNRGCANGRICMISMNRGDNNMNLFMKYENW